MTPRQIVQALDRYIIGQDAAKRAVAVAIRNRWRRLQLPPALQEDVAPKNILMVGATGVGKTEIARRIAQLVEAPFVKVEATKFTEVGYHGRDVESMVRDLTERAMVMERAAAAEQVRSRARELAEDRIIDELLPHGEFPAHDPESEERRRRTREKLRSQLQAGGLAERSIELNVEQKGQSPQVAAALGLDHPDIEQLFERVMPTRRRRQRFRVPDALEVLTQQEIDKLLDHEALHGNVVRRTEQTGIIFLDEMDKLASPTGGEMTGPEVSRSGVQRDLLPLVEGTTVSTRYGPVRTDHVLFIGAGAFSQSRPSDLMPELQGRFPLRVELEDLTGDDFHRILTEPQNALIKQQIELMRTEGVELEFTDRAIVEMAEMAWRANELLENIGARRLHTIVEKVMEDIAFHASDAANKQVVIDEDYVRMRLADVLDSEERREFEL